MGPGAGGQGGRIVAAGTPETVARSRASRTAPYLAQCLRGAVR
jgi:excinuclease ABC subunit A